MNNWWVYIIQSIGPRPDGKPGPGYTYVGSTNDPARRIRQHNGQQVGGAKSTSRSRPYEARALFGPYADRKEAWHAERALKRLRGQRRLAWSVADSPLCRGDGLDHEWVQNPAWTQPK